MGKFDRIGQCGLPGTASGVRQTGEAFKNAEGGTTVCVVAYEESTAWIQEGRLKLLCSRLASHSWVMETSLGVSYAVVGVRRGYFVYLLCNNCGGLKQPIGWAI